MNKLKVIFILTGLLFLIFLLLQQRKPAKEEIQTEEPPAIIKEEPDRTAERIRVVLKDYSENDIHHQEVTLIPDTSYEVIRDSQSVLHEAGEPVTVCYTAGDSQYSLFLIPSKETARTAIPSLQRSQGTPLYRGMFELQCTENGIVIINDLPLEEYLYAVVPSEMPSDYPFEALKAQAICARTYAVKQMQYSKYTDLGADVDDSTSYQVYNNTCESDAVNRAVDATRGKVATYDGKVKDTYYFSTSCGYTTDGGSWKEDSKEDMSYLTSRKLSEEAIEAWAVQGETDNITEEDFEAFIRSADAADYESKEPWYRWTMQIEGAALGRIDEKIKERYQVNPDKILTQNEKGIYQSVKPPEIGELQDIQVAMRGDGGVIESLIIVGSHATIQILTEYNVRYVMSTEGASIRRQDGSDTACGMLLPSAFFTMDIEYQDDRLESMMLYGGGYGHGTGMSQNCARSMALKGMTAENIIRSFYQELEIGDLSADML
ncbi:MAG: SpoIID/LytB domain-containing protein [bacterium]|nr:SpoIID/LytB domain-containing protein [bacterium]